MISPSEFLERWNSNLFGIVKYDESTIASLNIPKDAKDFLIIAGLPKSAAPYLGFKSSKRGGATKINDPNFLKYILIGNTGSGDSICIVEESGDVVYLDHENFYKEVSVNSSIPQLVESLLVYAEFVDKTNEENGENAFLDNNIPDGLIEWLTSRLKDIDAKALDIEGFWYEELNNLRRK